MTNTKTLLVFLLLPLALVICIVRTVSVRRHGITWLEELDSRITPLVLEEIIGPPERETPSPIASVSRENGDSRDSTPTVTEISTKEEAQGANGMRPDLELALDLPPDTGHMGRSYFSRLAGEMEDCRSKLRSSEPKRRHEGGLICHRLARQMVEDRGSCDGIALRVMDRYMSVFVDEILEICLRWNLPPSMERSEFALWTADHMENGGKSVLLFSIRLLGIMGEGSSLEAIGRYRQSGDTEIRRAAIWAMGMQGSPDVVDDIGAILSDRTLPASEGEAFLVALGRIGGMRASGILCGVMRNAPPLLAYDAYLSLRELRRGEDQPPPLSLEEFERGRPTIIDEYTAWLKNWEDDNTYRR